MNALPILDPRVLDRLREWGGPELLGRMIELFLELGPDRLASLRAGLEEGDFDAVGGVAHSLKSSAGNLGAERLRVASARLEEVANTGDREQIEVEAAALEGEYTEVVVALKSVRSPAQQARNP
jgi:HPt (histidine-containing phosphotransfer) domain-containing protein